MNIKEDNKKKITINKLAEMMQREFGAAQKRVEAIDNKLDNKLDGLKNEMNGKFDIVDRKFEKIDERFDQVLNNQDRVLTRLENLETDNKMDMASHRRQEDKLENHEKRISAAEKKLGIGVMV